MDEIDKYLLQKELDLKSFSTENPLFIKQYEYAQLLVAVGKHKEALKFYAESFTEATKWKNNTLFTNHYCLIGASYAIASDFTGDIAKAEELYNAIMAHNPLGPHIGDYALFLHRKKRDYDKAAAFYTKAIELFPDHSAILLKYAGFLRHVRRDIAQSEVYYLKSIEANPENADALGSYASFLHGVYNKTAEAEEYYIQAMKYDDTHTNNLCNYGLFLSEERGNYTQAEIYYKRSLQVNPSHSNTLYNYAVMLDTHLKRKNEAESLYRKTIAIETRHSYALYNLAVLLEERQFILNNAVKLRQKEQQEDPNDVSGFIVTPSAEEEKKQRAEIALLYKRAVDADPRDATTLADYGRYLLVRLEEPGKAEAALQGALKLDPQCEIAVYNMAVLLHKHKGNYEAAVSMLRDLVMKNPKHCAGYLQLARMLSGRYSTDHIDRKESCSAIVMKMIADMLEEALEFYEKAIMLTSDVDAVLSEYMKFSAKYGNNRQKLHTISFVNNIFKTKVKSEDNKLATTSPQDPNVTNAIALLEHLNASAKNSV